MGKEKIKWYVLGGIFAASIGLEATDETGNTNFYGWVAGVTGNNDSTGQVYEPPEPTPTQPYCYSVLDLERSTVYECGNGREYLIYTKDGDFTLGRALAEGLDAIRERCGEEEQFIPYYQERGHTSAILVTVFESDQYCVQQPLPTPTAVG